MSEQQTKRGKFKKIDLQGKTIEEWCEEQCKKERKTNKWEDETWKEFFFDIYWSKFFIVKEQLFEIIEEKDLDSCYYTQIDKQDDGTYSFYSTYYNGNTCLQECLEDELEKMI